MCPHTVDTLQKDLSLSTHLARSRAKLSSHHLFLCVQISSRQDLLQELLLLLFGGECQIFFLHASKLCDHLTGATADTDCSAHLQIPTAPAPGHLFPPPLIQLELDYLLRQRLGYSKWAYHKRNLWVIKYSLVFSPS